MWKIHIHIYIATNMLDKMFLINSLLFKMCIENIFYNLMHRKDQVLDAFQPLLTRGNRVLTGVLFILIFTFIFILHVYVEFGILKVHANNKSYRFWANCTMQMILFSV